MLIFWWLSQRFIVNNLRVKPRWERFFVHFQHSSHIDCDAGMWTFIIRPEISDQQSVHCERIIEKICLFHMITVVKSHFNYLINANDPSRARNNEMKVNWIFVWGHFVAMHSWIINGTFYYGIAKATTAIRWLLMMPSLVLQPQHGI